MALEHTIREIIEPSLKHEGFALVLVRLGDVQGRRTLQLMVERADGQQITVDECADISHTASALLDVEDPITGAYHLEVGSPGIDRPLVTSQDYDTYAGFEAKIETQIPVNGRKRYKGILRGINDDQIIDIEIDGQSYYIPYQDVAQAKLLLTDALIQAYQDKKINH